MQNIYYLCAHEINRTVCKTYFGSEKYYLIRCCECNHVVALYNLNSIQGKLITKVEAKNGYIWEEKKG